MSTTPTPRRTGNPFARPAVIAAGLLMAAGAIGMSAAIATYDLHLRKLPIYPEGGRVTGTVPTETASWERVGIDRIESPEVVEVLGTDNYVSRLYQNKGVPEGEDPVYVDFHMAYYTGKIDTVPHIPERCFVGGGLMIGDMHGEIPVPLDQSGWVVDEAATEIAGREIYTVRLPNRYSDRPGTRVRLAEGAEETRLRVSEFTNQTGRGRMFVGYFFITNGGIAASAEEVRARSFDLQQDYAYYLKIQFTSMSVDSAEELAEVAGDMLDELYGEIMRTVPDWIEVQAGRYPPDNPSRPDA